MFSFIFSKFSSVFLNSNLRCINVRRGFQFLAFFKYKCALLNHCSTLVGFPYTYERDMCFFKQRAGSNDLPLFGRASAKATYYDEAALRSTAMHCAMCSVAPHTRTSMRCNVLCNAMQFNTEHSFHFIHLIIWFKRLDFTRSNGLTACLNKIKTHRTHQRHIYI